MNISKAKKILERITTAEKAVELTGPARKEYLDALDVVHGPVEKRAKDMGFGKETFYHGTNADIDSFSHKQLNDDGYFGSGHYFTPDAGIADFYASTYNKASDEGANIIPVKLKTENPLIIDGSKGSHRVQDVNSFDSALSKHNKDSVIIKKKDVDDSGRVLSEWTDEVVVKEPSQIRSVNAAFDLRFADSPKLLAGGAAIPAMGNQFANPADIIKSGYEKFEQARQSVVNKIADVTDMGLNENPYVPQHAKDTYNKAADALLQNVTDPLNAVPGFGAVDAAVGAAATGLEMYSDANAKKNVPQTSYVAANPVTNPVQTFKVKP